MFNCIESDALMDVCLALGIESYWIHEDDAPKDIYIVGPGTIYSLELNRDGFAFKLSDYLLATAPVDVKEA